MENKIFFYYYILSFTHCVLGSLVMPMTTPGIFSDQSALLALKDHITLDPNQILMKNWTVRSSICEWIGVICDSRHYRVTVLNISNIGLTGTIVPQLGNLSFLVSLDFSRNNFHGNLPQELAQLRRLKVLNFSINALSGEIPSGVFSWNHLEYLYLNNNSFTGSIPSSISNMSNLKEVILYQNQLSGSIPFEIFNISSLEQLSLAFNSLSGNLPCSLCRHLQKLKWIILGSNFLSGPLPLELSQCAQLQVVALFSNNFSGPIPKDLWSMKRLEEADLRHNSLEGMIPKEIGNLTLLQRLFLFYNHLTGVVPKEISNLTKLTYLFLGFNNLRGAIPQELGKLPNLEFFGMGFNGLSGLVPAEIFNMSTLRRLSVCSNYLSGNLPSAIGSGLPNLEEFLFYANNFSGVIPPSISNSSRLRNLELMDNNFMGTIPHSLGNLRFLEFLGLGGNKLTRESSSLELEFLTPLTNCRHLRYLEFDHNHFNGILSKSIGNLSKSIIGLYANDCGISGKIPDDIGNLSALMTLSLSNNQFFGSLPSSIASLQNLQGLYLSNNELSGTLPHNLYDLQRLNVLFLSQNMFSGQIPELLSNITSLGKVWLSFNRFSSTIPISLWNLKDILEVNLSSNFLTGSVPIQIGNSNIVTLIDLSMNKLSGCIPMTIGSLHLLTSFSLAFNMLEGSIPCTIGNMLSLMHLDLSQNNLSGSIPKTMEQLHYLKSFNASYNNLVGLFPPGGPFENFTGTSFIFNKALYGEPKFQVPPCPAMSPRKLWLKDLKYILILSSSLVAFIGTLTLGAVYLIRRRKVEVKKMEGSPLLATKERISFYELQHATDGYNERNFLGHGSFGSVYKGTLRDGRIIPVKVFNLQIEAACKSFEVECEVLGNLRHRNLVRVISSCASLHFKALVLEFMPNGSLEKWLHSGNYFLKFIERLNIMIGVAEALQYLHSGYTTPVVHSDLKPSNVLLDEDMIARVSDFGIAKIMEGKSISYTATLATFGYIAPEYGSEGLVSTKCDVYSFGIMLMEVFTKKTPDDKMFNKNLTLQNWVNDSIMGSKLHEIIDDALLQRSKEEHYAMMLECVSMIMKVALNCTRASPKERSGIGEVGAALGKIKLKLSLCSYA